MHHIIMFSGGLGSFATAKLIQDTMEKGDTIELLFSDTLSENPDLYRFNKEVSEKLKIKLTVIKDGRNLWELFNSERFVANSRLDICSRVLKRELIDKWIETNYPDSDSVRIHIGIDVSEIHRIERLKPSKLPYIYTAPLIDCNDYQGDTKFKFRVKHYTQLWLNELNIRIPELYTLNFPHNNCGGACLKAGLAQWKMVYQHYPELYKYHENKELNFQETISKSHKGILRKQVNGVKTYITLEHYRVNYLELEEASQLSLFTLEEKYDYGGCACALE